MRCKRLVKHIFLFLFDIAIFLGVSILDSVYRWEWLTIAITTIFCVRVMGARFFNFRQWLAGIPAAEEGRFQIVKHISILLFDMTICFGMYTLGCFYKLEGLTTGMAIIFLLRVMAARFFTAMRWIKWFVYTSYEESNKDD